ncbi:ribonuclease P protein component [Winogradskyella immobilis]|uniref:Ribonuclease P protein component n=1 Tax=Winogradskyella immobilis TaxID=2816852 RepID=A0ABS8EJQ9_9FLAO|nr:ribonuclease P protein component [Winogradskyella immobilis]MCC1483434.1 ribonuclease P protein component [Winogradskyella immobilis]MCG0015528.1 ribonuclease P protein component [Winogradskyella immobilis]
MRNTYPKKEKLKSKKLIEQLFTEGRSISIYPIRLIYLKTDDKDAVLLKTGVSVSKRLHKKAVTRNRIKRLLREAYRLNKNTYFNKNTTPYTFMFLYIGKEETDFKTLDRKMKLLLEKFKKQNPDEKDPS